jgi:hypothetical protein
MTEEVAGPFFVMELVKGTPITRYCDEQKLTPRIGDSLRPAARARLN